MQKGLAELDDLTLTRRATPNATNVSSKMTDNFITTNFKCHFFQSEAQFFNLDFVALFFELFQCFVFLSQFCTKNYLFSYYFFFMFQPKRFTEKFLAENVQVIFFR